MPYNWCEVLWKKNILWMVWSMTKNECCMTDVGKVSNNECTMTDAKYDE